MGLLEKIFEAVRWRSRCVVLFAVGGAAGHACGEVMDSH